MRKPPQNPATRSASPTYVVWAEMKSRCYNTGHRQYKYYGAKGATVCNEWRNSYKAFLCDMDIKPYRQILSRIDESIPYCKSNCIWVPKGRGLNVTKDDDGNLSKTYRVWTEMRARCLAPTHPRYHNYGARGVTICAEWAEYSEFFNDMGGKPYGKALTRIDSSLPYCKANCEWGTPRRGRRRPPYNPGASPVSRVT